MAHNTSPGKRARKLRCLPLRDLARTILAIDCANHCGVRTIRVRDIAGVYGADQTLMSTLLRLRCQACGGMPADAWLISGRQRVAVWGRETW